MWGTVKRATRSLLCNQPQSSRHTRSAVGYLRDSHVQPQGTQLHAGGLDGDAPARHFIEAQDREIAERSGRARARIKSVGRAGR
jgi:hypothetical protein